MSTKLAKGVKLATRILRIQKQRVNEYITLQRQRLHVEARLSSRPSKIGLMGCGRQGIIIAAAVRSLPGWEISDLFDLRPQAARRAQNLWPTARLHETAESFFRNGAFDIVAIATIASSHFELASAAVDHGMRRIFLEKPVTNRLTDADKLIEVADRAGSIITVDHTRRFLDSVPGLKRILTRGALGSPRAIHFLSGRAGMAMVGTHLFDLSRWLLDADIVRVRAELDATVDPTHADVAHDDYVGRCEIRLSNATRVTMDLSDDLPVRQLCFFVACEEGRLEVDERLGTLRLVGRGERVWETRYALAGAHDVGIGRALVELAEGRPPRCDLRKARAALEAVVACHVSHRRDGEWIDLPLTGNIRDQVFEFA